MPLEHKSRREVLDAIKTLSSISELLSAHDGHFDYEIDLEVVVYGRNYSGKKVGPYARLLIHDPGEAVVTEGEWGGNTFYFVVDQSVDIFINTHDKGEVKVAQLTAGSHFGEMSLLAGVPRNATVKAASTAPTRILEVQRPALRLLRKLPQFGDILDRAYRSRGRDNTLDVLKEIARLNPEMMSSLRNIAQFKVFSKNHVLFRQNATVDRLVIVKEGWIKRAREAQGQGDEDFIGSGFCFGLEGIKQNEVWPYAATLMGRTEILEIPIGKLRSQATLREALAEGLARLAPPALGSRVQFPAPVRARYLAAQEKLIDTGLVDATNLLVMDMDLCVRCGNCSLACHNARPVSTLRRHARDQIRRRNLPRFRACWPRQSACTVRTRNA
jgi:CRP-like cAMP-binding protein